MEEFGKLMPTGGDSTKSPFAAPIFLKTIKIIYLSSDYAQKARSLFVLLARSGEQGVTGIYPADLPIILLLPLWIDPRNLFKDLPSSGILYFAIGNGIITL